MILPTAALLLVVTTAASGAGTDGGAAAARVSSFPMEPAPGLARVLVSGVPPVPGDFEAWLAPYTQVRSATLADPGDDGRSVLIHTRFGSVRQVHRVSTPMGAREQLTFGTEPVGKARWQPGDPRWLFFLQDPPGGDASQLYRLDLRNGQRQLLTDGKSRHSGFVLSRDGRQLAFAGTGRNGRDTDVYLADVASPTTARRLTEETGLWIPIDFSPDGRQLLVEQQRGADDADLWVVDAAGGARTRLTPEAAEAGKASIRDAAFGADGRSVYLVTDRDTEFAQLFRVDLAHPDARWRSLSADLKWNVDQLAVAADGTVAFVANEDGSSTLYLQKPREARRTRVPAPSGVIGEMRFPNRTSDVLTFSLETSTAPSDVWQLALKSGRLTRWTQSEVGGIDPAHFSPAELVHYPSGDGLIIPAFLHRPRGLRPGTKAPVVVDWHGGPDGQARPDFDPLAQALLDLGIAVLRPNVRGSDGYGKRFLAADDGVKREQALKDIGATLEFIARQPDLDPARVAAQGGGYGGYLSLASVAFYPDRFRAAVDLVGVSSLPGLLARTQPFRRDLRRAEYGDERLPEVRQVLDRISPLGSAERIRAAVYVLQGRNDARVPQSEAEQIVRAVREQGRTAWYLLALDGGHGLERKETRDYVWMTTLVFLREQLVAAPEAPPGNR